MFDDAFDLDVLHWMKWRLTPLAFTDDYSVSNFSTLNMRSDLEELEKITAKKQNLTKIDYFSYFIYNNEITISIIIRQVFYTTKSKV